MNDFTKEELFILHDALYGLGRVPKYPTCHALVGKIKSMFSNYRESNCMNDFTKLELWILGQQLECIPTKENKEVHWLHHSTSALTAYENVLTYLRSNHNDKIYGDLGNFNASGGGKK